MSEDAVEDFYATSVDDLKERLKKQIENEKAFFVDDPENGYQAKFCDGVLEVFGPNGTAVVKDTRRKINNYRRQKVKRIVIGRGITEIADLAFDDYENLEVCLSALMCAKLELTALTAKTTAVAMAAVNWHPLWSMRKMPGIRPSMACSIPAICKFW